MTVAAMAMPMPAQAVEVGVVAVVAGVQAVPAVTSGAEGRGWGRGRGGRYSLPDTVAKGHTCGLVLPEPHHSRLVVVAYRVCEEPTT